jgi:hypothetical protein
VMAPIRHALRPITGEMVDACLARKLFPHSIISNLNMAQLLSRVLIAARTAEELTSVPASILIAEVWFAGVGASDKEPDANDWFGTGRKYPSIEACFLDYAYRLSREEKFQPVMRAKDDPEQYVKQIGSCKLWDKGGRADRVEQITLYNLLEIDARQRHA